jgi:PEP-CTERM motif
VDPVTSAQVLLGGAIGTLSDLDASLDCDTVYATATSTTAFSPGRLYAIDVATPGASQVANVSLPDIGPAVAVVPEPATFALVALGLVILASRRRAIR